MELHQGFERADWSSVAGTWCPTPRKALFLRPEAPRRPGRMGLRRLGRGAPLPATPCFFVRRHHVSWFGWAFVGRDVVLHCPQTLISSSGSTTSFGSDEPSATGTWCSTARKPLFLRPEAPRRPGRMGLRRLGRGASPPANPCSFVRRHHVSRAGWDEVGNGRVVSLPFHIRKRTAPATRLGAVPSSFICFQKKKKPATS